MKTIRISEESLHRIISESVKSVLTEDFDSDWENRLQQNIENQRQAIFNKTAKNMRFPASNAQQMPQAQQTQNNNQQQFAMGKKIPINAFMCSNCGEVIYDSGQTKVKDFKFCPNCRAKFVQ